MKGREVDDEKVGAEDLEKAELGLSKRSKTTVEIEDEDEDDVIREEAAVVDVVDDMTGALGEVKLEGDGEGVTLPRPIPEGQVSKDLIAAEKIHMLTLSSGEKEQGKDKAKSSMTAKAGKKPAIELDPEMVKLHGKRNATKIANGKLVIEDGKGYDMSLVKAMYYTVAWRWWKAVILSACGCEWCGPLFSPLTARLSSTLYSSSTPSSIPTSIGQLSVSPLT